MEILIDPNAGFCFGVVKAIAAAEEHLIQNKQLYCLGDIVHNNAEVQRLTSKGLTVIDHEQLQELRHTRVLIRAHGEPPETYATAKQHDIELVDATCPIVLALQKRIKEGYEQMCLCGGQIVIFGKQGHAEVIGLNGQTGNTAIIISSPDDIAPINPARPIRLYSQTTKSKEDYQRLIDNIKGTGCTDFVAYNTLCNRVSHRSTELESFASNVDALIFVSGSNSSNGRYLYSVCQKVQSHTLFVSAPMEVDPHSPFFKDVKRVGITGATSTPRWLMEAVSKRLTEATV